MDLFFFFHFYNGDRLWLNMKHLHELVPINPLLHLYLENCNCRFKKLLGIRLKDELFSVSLAYNNSYFFICHLGASAIL